MSLEARAANGTSGYTWPVDAETGVVIATRTADISATDDVIVRASNTGTAVIHGWGSDEVVNWSLEGTALSNGIRNTSIGDDYSFSTPFSVGAHNSANKTHVILTMSEPHSLGDFKKFNAGGKVLPF